MSRNKSNYAYHDILDGDACIYKRHDNGSSFWQFRMWIKDEKMNTKRLKKIIHFLQGHERMYKIIVSFSASL